MKSKSLSGRRCEFAKLMKNLTGATISGRSRDWVDTVGLRGSSAEKITRGFIEVNEVIAYSQVTDFFSSVSSWGCGTIIRVQNKFCPLGAALWEVDSGIIFEGQLDCSLGEDQDLDDIVDRDVVHTLRSERDRGYIPNV